MSEFRLYDTMSRAVEPFAPVDGQTVRMYTCGPTVYNPAHLGNFRTFLFEDLLRRALRLRGWSVDQVMNLTDVDDKIIAKAHAEGMTISAITDPVIKIFHADRRYLKIEDAEHYPRATAYIPQMILLVERLVARELAYRTDDGSVYFAIGRFPRYGRLSRLDTRELKVGARVAQDDYSKENAQDFALWKAAKPEDERAGAAWDSPWGRGRPGWHLECSAMALALLGDTLDLHCGGVDLIFPKRVGNVMAVADLRAARISGAALRHLMFTTHYRQVLNLSEAALEASQRAVAHVGEFAERLAAPGTTGGTPAMAAIADEFTDRVRSALFDDLNAPQALAAVFDFLRAANADLDRRGHDRAALERAQAAVAFIEETLGIVPPPRTGGMVGALDTPARAGEATDAETPDAAAFRSYVEERLRARAEARTGRDFAAADVIRAELSARGVSIADSGDGTSWKKTG